MGVSGCSIVEMIISGGKRIIFFVHSSCHFIFILFVDGNMVKCCAVCESYVEVQVE